MHTIKLKAHIDHDRRLEIQLPIDVPEGDAEVTVSIPSNDPNEALRRRHLEALLEQSTRNGNAGRSAADIDRQPGQARDSSGK